MVCSTGYIDLARMYQPSLAGYITLGVRSQMIRLNHPLKRLSFVLFLCGAVALMGLAMFPTPFEISSYPEWKDAAASNTPDRHVTRIDTACAGTQLGTTEEFARAFFIVDAFSSENKYSRLITEMQIEGREPFTIAPIVDLTEKEKAAFFSTLSGEKKPCLNSVCAEKLDTALLASILKACGTQVGQLRKDAHEVRWRILNNLEGTFPWSLFTFLLSVLFLLCSLLYDRTLGPLISWVRSGSW